MSKMPEQIWALLEPEWEDGDGEQFVGGTWDAGRFKEGAQYTHDDTAAAQVAAAYERGAELFDEKHHVFMVAKGRNPSDYMSEFSNAADKLRALATDTQADALELVRKEAEQTGYERGARLARNMALIEAAEIADQWATDAQRKHGNGGPKAQILSLMTIDEQTEAAQELAFRKAVSS